jgi:hypothetical protein
MPPKAQKEYLPNVKYEQSDRTEKAMIKQLVTLLESNKIDHDLYAYLREKTAEGYYGIPQKEIERIKAIKKEKPQKAPKVIKEPKVKPSKPAPAPKPEPKKQTLKQSKTFDDLNKLLNEIETSKSPKYTHRRSNDDIDFLIKMAEDEIQRKKSKSKSNKHDEQFESLSKQASEKIQQNKHKKNEAILEAIKKHALNIIDIVMS